METNKRIIIVRHAKATHDELYSNDIERPLTDRGHTEAHFIADRLNKLKIKPDLIICSPALRTYATALILQQTLKILSNQLILDASVYASDVNALIKLMKHHLTSVSSLILVGHNPELESLVNLLSGSEIVSLPVAGTVIFCLKSNVIEFTKGCCITEEFIIPVK